MTNNPAVYIGIGCVLGLWLLWFVRCVVMWKWFITLREHDRKYRDAGMYVRLSPSRHEGTWIWGLSRATYAIRKRINLIVKS